MSKPADFKLRLQAFQVEPAIVSQAINNGMRRVRSTNAKVQEAERFLEALLGRKLTYTMADVGPLAQAVRTRVGFADAGVPKTESLKRVSVYAQLLGQALYIKMRMAAYMELMRAYSEMIADARSGPPTAMGPALVKVASDNVDLWETKDSRVDPFCTSGDSKDLYMLLQGSSDSFSESPPYNLFYKDAEFPCGLKIDLLTQPDGKADVDAVFTEMKALATVLKDTILKPQDYDDVAKASRAGKDLQFVDSAGAALTNLKELQAAFAANGRLFVGTP
jgi:hypothetical protein